MRLRSTRALLVLVLLAAGSTGCVVFANRFHVPAEVEPAPVSGSAAEAPWSGDRLRLVTWNIGYAGMGRESDFIADGGSQRRPLSAELVAHNLDAIVETVARLDLDVYLLQEVTRPSWISYQRDSLEALRGALPGYAWVFGPDLKTRWMPRPFRVVVGNAIFSRLPIATAEWRGLPLEPGFHAGLFRKGYRMHVARFATGEGGAEWVLVNVHLAAFDDGAEVRRRQLREVVAFAQREYRDGNRVVVGGDWNLRLEPTEFPHRTEERHLFWIYDLPPELTPAGWHWGIDSRVPTVRTAHQPYVEGDNYTTIIDGFLCSPNVRIDRVETLDLGFAHTDHQPVVVEVSAATSEAA